MVAMSRFLDERGRILGKVNIIDLLVLLVIVAVVILAAVRFKDASLDTVPVRVNFIVGEVRAAEVAALKVEGVVTDDGGTVFGQVQEVAVAPSREEMLTGTGELKVFDSPIFSDVVVEVLGQGVVSGSSVRVGSVPIRVGKRIKLIGVGFEVETTILSVVWGEEATK
jgi:hypothetical protein